jgi:hypothetical protein
MDAAEQLLLAASAERIGLLDAHLHITGADGTTPLDDRCHLADHAAPLFEYTVRVQGGNVRI